MKWFIGSLVALALAMVIWCGWYVNDYEKNQIGYGAAEAIAAEPEQVNSSETQAMLHDRIIGKKEAPVKVVILSSFSCYHCANFHKEVLPVLKSKYINEGKISLYYYDIAMDNRSATAGMLARCMPDDEYWKFADTVMSNQMAWATSVDYKEILGGYAAIGGMGKDKVEKCINNKALLKAMLAQRDQLIKKYDIKGTPSIFVEKDGKRYEVPNGKKGSMIFAKIDELLGSGQAPVSQAAKPISTGNKK